jgi:hypothetical protein
MVRRVMPRKKWKQNKSHLYRGDHKDAVSVPRSDADGSVVRHVLYLEGPGRETPYLSTSEQREVAERFAQAGGVWETSVTRANAEGVKYISRLELLGILRGNGKGAATWSNAFEVMQARRYVEQHAEHLLDFRETADAEVATKKIFVKS